MHLLSCALHFYLYFLGFFPLCLVFVSMPSLFQNAFALNKKSKSNNRNYLTGIQIPIRELLFQF